MAFDHNSEMRAGQPCGQWEPFIVLLAAGEDFPAELHSEWIMHSAECEACSNALAQERELLALLGEHRSEPDTALLASCRASLDDAIDRQEEHGWLRGALGFLLPRSWLAAGPAWSAVALLLVGFSSGILLGPRVLRRPATPDKPAPVATAALQASDPAPMVATPHTLDLHSADVAGINVLPTGGVEFQMRQQQPVTVQGSIDDDSVKDVLINILRGGDRFCPDVRLDAVDLLRTRNDDPEVRTALCHAVHNDKNAAVRLKALEALNGAEPQDTVQQTLLDALVDDQNPGVRVEAINELREMASKGQVDPSDKMLSVLQDRMENDPNAYIRLQSAAAIRDLGPRGRF
ncbi:MAG TPA: HEAT repeat domain-containing protein [Candidatus Acidoferrum sp.]|jgi:hypothetical protein|nr:HEAT repeat domain-containing protein [Candidatus Acidoferrum sp.]